MQAVYKVQFILDEFTCTYVGAIVAKKPLVVQDLTDTF